VGRVDEALQCYHVGSYSFTKKKKQKKKNPLEFSHTDFFLSNFIIFHVLCEAMPFLTTSSPSSSNQSWKHLYGVVKLLPSSVKFVNLIDVLVTPFCIWYDVRVNLRFWYGSN